MKGRQGVGAQQGEIHQGETHQSEPAARVTILDVAKAAGVSKSSVSRFLDERMPRSDTETARRVRRVAAELGYVRDASASSLRRGRTDTIGIIVPRLTDTVMAMLYEALTHAAMRNGQFTIVATTDDEPDADRHAAEALLRRGVDGLILATTRDGDTLAQALTARGVPCVLALRTNGTHPSSVGDDLLGGYLATRHLIDLGHQRIGLIAGPAYASNARGRLQGYRKAMTEAGLPIAPGWIQRSSFGIETGGVAAGKLMDLALPPTAIFAVNDNTAIGALAALIRLGVSIPGDVSLVGYNDIPIVSHLATPLTSVKVPFEHIAHTALELLAGDMAELREPVRVATPTLIPRRSTAMLRNQ